MLTANYAEDDKDNEILETRTLEPMSMASSPFR